jgi:hypothetical protein
VHNPTCGCDEGAHYWKREVERLRVALEKIASHFPVENDDSCQVAARLARQTLGDTK